MNTRAVNRRVFEKVEGAFKKLTSYEDTRDLELLKTAEIELAEATEEDPDYIDAAYFSGLLKDTIGKAAEASAFFEKVLGGTKNSELKIETEYNLGVSYYHRYGHSYLKKAEEHFRNVIAETKSKELIALANASLAQTYAMWMIPSSDQKEARNTKAGLDLIVSNMVKFMPQVTKRVEKARKFLARPIDSKDPKHKKRRLKIEAMVSNALGMAEMYFSDYGLDDKTRLEKLVKAKEYLLQSENKVAKDWANTCDMGSVAMRFGYVSKDPLQKDTFFKEAINYMNLVIDGLRPEYGFAFYELGRIYRLKGDFSEAKKQFERALAIDEAYRDVSDKNVNKEKDRAEKRDTSFP